MSSLPLIGRHGGQLAHHGGRESATSSSRNPLALPALICRSAPTRPAIIRRRRSRRRCDELVDFDRINRATTRLTVGAANVRTSEMRYFDSRDMALGARHVMASGALPPAFPAVRIDGELYWDGGILSNTPVEAVFDDDPRRNSLVFAVHIWNPDGSEPETIWQVMNRQKDIQYSSRAVQHIARQKQIAPVAPRRLGVGASACPRSERKAMRCASWRNMAA